ncbi:MAG: hypothetical protein JWR61_1760 [Ferruginibacter sp.]|uniref:hypothetical protein n=1 Tax=Ferruginibacter sp. TaxID=1940288 RepID=UPI0026597F4A|nr:hypothetical protein [Ferruginibacter sp.]MDB5276805.1 hypothetical protein [Ferruginibacter sp.]
MKNNITCILIAAIVLLQSCSKQDYFDVPKDSSGNVIITTVASTTSAGISTLDDNFTINAVLPNAKAGDEMTVELLKQQVPAGAPAGSATQLLPIAGTQKKVTVAADFTASVQFTRSEATMTKAGDVVTVTFAGKTESAMRVITMVKATTVSGTKYNNKVVPIIRSAGTAYFEVKVAPKLAAYAGTVLVKNKNGINDPWQTVGSFPGTSQVPISGDDFAIGKDTMYYAFISQVGSYSDTVTQTILNSNPYFQFKKTGKMTLGGASAGVNMFVNGAVAASNAMAMMAIDDSSLTIHGGSAWAVGGKGISFVKSTLAVYNENNSDKIMTAFMAGTPTATADPTSGEGVYIFKIVNGPNATDIFYGILKVVSIVPGSSINYEYRIGNLYAQLAVLQ